MPDTPSYAFAEMVENQPNHHLIFNQLINELECKFGFVISQSTSAQPGAPSEGDAYIMPASPTGAVWSTYAQNCIALYYSNSWFEFNPVEGWNVFVKDEDTLLYFNGADWERKSSAWTNIAGGLQYTGGKLNLTGLTVHTGPTEPGGLIVGDLWVDDSTTPPTVRYKAV